MTNQAKTATNEFRIIYPVIGHSPLPAKSEPKVMTIDQTLFLVSFITILSFVVLVWKPIMNWIVRTRKRV